MVERRQACKKHFSVFFFLQKLIICMLEIILAKFEVIMASETPSFIPVLVQMYFFLTFKRCSSRLKCTFLNEFVTNEDTEKAGGYRMYG